eukprot:159919_1
MKATKNPKKLNTSFWETAFNDGNAQAAPVKKKKKGRKKKKTKMTAMWEDKFETQKQQVDSTSYKPKPKPNPTSDDATNIETNPDDTTVVNKENTDDNVPASSSTTEPIKDEPKPKKISKVGALAGKLNINPMGMRGGIPPSLRKKREEAKEKDTALPSQEFERPVIPSTVQRKKATKEDILTITSNEIKQALNVCLSETFVFDESMIVNESILCSYLRDIAGIDLSLIGDSKWDSDILIDTIKDVFGDKVQHPYGYQLRA